MTSNFNTGIYFLGDFKRISDGPAQIGAHRSVEMRVEKPSREVISYFPGDRKYKYKGPVIIYSGGGGGGTEEKLVG